MTVDFYLGTDIPSWLSLAGVPLFLSRRYLERRRVLPRAIAPWSLDSGGYSELTMFDRWQITPAAYASVVRRCRDEIGLMRWAAPMDWMCGPEMLKRTGLSVEEHQRRTTANYLELLNIAPDLPWIPVLQGWREYDYHAHVDAYTRAGIDLTAEPIVGIGTVCAREATGVVAGITAKLAAEGIRLHGFGIKTRGLLRTAHVLASADSTAWFKSAVWREPMAGHSHNKCNHCLIYALEWRDRVFDAITQGKNRKQQLVLQL